MIQCRDGLTLDTSAQPEPRSQTLELRRCVRNLVALAALPATWRDFEPNRIADSAASALVSMLNAEFVYIELPRERDEATADIVKTAAAVDSAGQRSIAAAVKLEIRNAGARQPSAIANPSPGPMLRLATAPIGLDGTGVVVVGSASADFPSEAQRLVLATAANETTLGLQRWRSETEMRRFMALVERSSDFVGYADLDGTARYVNPAGMRLVGLDACERVPPLAIMEFLVPQDRPRARDEAWPIVRQTGRWVGELTFRNFTTGAGIPVLLDWFRLDDCRIGGAINIAAVGRDLRAQKQSELELRGLNETLENRVVRRTTELADANQKLREEMLEHERLESRLREAHLELGHASRLSAAGQMAAALAHELNQPLTAIANSLSAAKRLLARGSFVGIDSTKEAMDEAVEQALRAGQVVRRLRSFLIRGDIEARVENVASMVDEASALALIGSSALGVELRVCLDPEAPRIVANRIEIQQVLINLMRNSIEAMAGMDRRELLLTTTLRPLDRVEFAVADNGPGVDTEAVERIFEPFVTTKRDGMGIGLSICRSIIERHGGRLGFEPNPGGGAIFRFTVRAVRAHEKLDVG